MKELLKERCDLFVANLNAIAEAWKWENRLMHVCVAAMYAMQNRHADTDTLKETKNLLRSRVGMFSNFRGTAESIASAKLAMSGRPEELLDQSLAAYESLKKHFFSSSYLPTAALVMAECMDPARYDEISAQARVIYDRMKKEHPMLTSSEDVTLCLLMALSGKNVDLMIADMEACYAVIKPEYTLNGDAVQAISQVLALADGNAEEKSARFLSLKKAFTDIKHKWGIGFESSALALMSLCDADMDALIQDTLDCEAYLKQQKYFSGFFSPITAKQLLMYAGLLAYSQHSSSRVAESAVIGTAISTIIVEQAAMTVVILAIASSSAASSASH